MYQYCRALRPGTTLAGRNPHATAIVPHPPQGFPPLYTCRSRTMEDYEDYYDEDEDEDPMSEDEEYDEDEEDNDYGFALNSQADVSVVPRANYKCFGQSDIKDKQAEATARVVAVLQVDADNASQLLRHFKWNVNRVNDEWFQDEDAVRAAVGLPPTDQQAPLASNTQEKVNPLPCVL